MNGYLIPLTCPACGADVAPVADGRPNAAGTTTTAVCRCVECRRGWVVHVNLLGADLAETPSGGVRPAAPAGPQAFTTCKVCGAEMAKYPISGRGTARVTCGKECASASRAAHNRARAEARRDPKSTSRKVSA